MLAFLEAKERPLVSEMLFLKGKPKGCISSNKSYPAVLCLVDKDDEKTMGLKPVSVTPLDLLPSVLANGGEEVRTAVNSYEYDLRVSRSSAVLSSIAAKKIKETKGSFVIYWLKMFLGFSRLEMVLVRGYLGRLVGLGFKPNGFRPKIDSKKPIIHLKPVYKSLGQGFKLFFSGLLFSPKTLGMDLQFW